MAHTIVHFEIPADDLPALKAFYEGLFQWSIVPSGMEGMEYLLVNTVKEGEHGVNGGMMPRSPGQGGISIYISVDSVDDVCLRTAQLGGTVLEPKMAIPGVGYAAFVIDPQGNAFGLFQDDPTAA